MHVEVHRDHGPVVPESEVEVGHEGQARRDLAYHEMTAHHELIGTDAEPDLGTDSRHSPGPGSQRGGGNERGQGSGEQEISEHHRPPQVLGAERVNFYPQDSRRHTPNQ